MTAGGAQELLRRVPPAPRGARGRDGAGLRGSGGDGPNRPDRGRDISATKTVEDALSGSRVLRVILQCRHWPTRGIGVGEVSKLVHQMSLWVPPKVDELVIATTGRFATDAVDWIEKHNRERALPLIAMWPNSHLELLLAARPHLVAQFRLR